MACSETLQLHVVECEGARSVALSPNGKYICLARVGPNGAAVVQTNSTFVCEMDGTQGFGVECVSWANDSLRVAAGGKSPTSPNALQPTGGFVVVCDSQTGARIFATQREAQVLCVAFSTNDAAQRLAASRIDGIVEVLDAYTGDPLHKVRLRGYADRWSHRSPFSGIAPDLPLPPRSGAPPTPCSYAAWLSNGEHIVVAHASAATVVDLNLVPGPPFFNTHPGGNQSGAQGTALDDDTPDDTHTFLAEARLPCGSLVTAVATSPRAEDPQLMALCGGPSVVIANAINGAIITQRRLDDFGGGGNNWQLALSVAFCPPRAVTTPKADGGTPPASSSATEPALAQQQSQAAAQAQQQPAQATEVAKAVAGQLRLVVGGELAVGSAASGAVAVFDAISGSLLSVHQARSAVLSVSVAADGSSMALGERRATELQQQQHAAAQLQQQVAQQPQPPHPTAPGLAKSTPPELQVQQQQRLQQQQQALATQRPAAASGGVIQPQPGQHQQPHGQPVQQQPLFGGTPSPSPQQLSQQGVVQSPAAAETGAPSPSPAMFKFGAGASGTRIEPPPVPKPPEERTSRSVASSLGQLASFVGAWVLLDIAMDQHRSKLKAAIVESEIDPSAA